MHTTVFDLNWDVMEFQIVSHEMNYLNTYWITTHFLYRDEDVSSNKWPYWIKNMMEIWKMNKDSAIFLERIKEEVFGSYIQCYTTKWSQISLPKDSTLLDFIYKVNKDLWDRFGWAYVNGKKIDNPMFVLSDWDVVNILRQNKAYSFFKIDYITIVKTNITRESLKQFFKKHSKDQRIRLWKFILNQVLEVLWFVMYDDLPYHIKKSILKKFSFKDKRVLFDAIWSWNFDHNKVTKYVSSIYFKSNKIKYIFFKIYLEKNDSNALDEIILQFRNMDIEIRNIIVKKKFIIINFLLDTIIRSENLFTNLNKIQNVTKVKRIFSFRLMLFYLLLLFVTVLILLNPIILIYLQNLEISGMYGFFADILFNSIFIVLIVLVYLFRYIIKISFPNIFNHRHFWLAMIFLNTIVLWTIIWWSIEIKSYFNHILFMWLWFVIYALVIFDFVTYRLEHKNL